MNEPSSDRLVLRELPILWWIFGGIFIATAIWLMFQPGAMLTAIICLAVGLLFGVVISPAETYTVDRTTGMFTIRRQWIIFGKTIEVPLADISGIDMESHRSRNKGRISVTYRIVLRTQQGETIPLSMGYSSGMISKQRKISKLREFTSLGGAGAPLDVFSPAARQEVGRTFGEPQEGQTEGVVWHMETSSYGASPVIRWYTDQFSFPGQFLLLAQKPTGSKNIFGPSGGGGVMSSLSQLVYRQLISMYGFQTFDTPGIETAETLDPLDPRLDAHFAALTSDPYGARQLLNPWVVNPLEQWAGMHPLKQIQGKNQAGQLVVLFSPNSLYVCMFNASSPEFSQAVARLGVDLTRALVTLPPTAP